MISGQISCSINLDWERVCQNLPRLHNLTPFSCERLTQPCSLVHIQPTVLVLLCAFIQSPTQQNPLDARADHERRK